MISATGPTNVSTINYTGALTPDALMTYCATRLHNLDTEMQTHFQKQQDYRAASAALNDLQGLASSWASGNGFKGSTKEGNEAWDKLHADFTEVYSHLPPDSKEATAIHALEEDVSNKVMTNLGGKEALTKDEAKNFSDRLGSIIKDLSSSAELDMIGLQSLMSQRQTAIQVCTNLIASLGESQKAIAQKVA